MRAQRDSSELHPLSARRLGVIEAQLGAQLAGLLRELYDRDGRSFGQISTVLDADYGLTVSRVTVRHWYVMLVGAPRSKEAAMEVYYEGIEGAGTALYSA